MHRTVAALMTAALLSASAQADVAVTGGTVHGDLLPDGTAVFRSIPFAAPPVGDLRWQKPQPVVPWEGVRDVTKQAPPCVQRGFGWNDADAFNGKEDCLYISVQVPPLAADAKLPVMVWIHGGANWAVDGHDVTLSPITRGGVILVTLQYRLGIFGFLSLPALSAASPAKTSGNYAIMDQIAALQWVHDNIASFGGDPGNVTIFGESAGAQNVGLLMLSPLARGLFHKAIAQSGTAGFGVPPRSLSENEKIGRDLLAQMGLSDDAAGLAGLRAASPEALLDATDHLRPPVSTDPSFLFLQAVADGLVIPKTPMELLTKAKQAPVPLIIGNNAREFTVLGAREWPERWMEENAPGKGKELAALYGAEPAIDPVQGRFADRLSNDVIFRCPASFVADKQAALTDKVWRYQFSVPAPDTVDGVLHAGELKYVFLRTPMGATPASWPPLARYWTNFAKTGDPNGEGLPVWPAYGKDQHYIDFTAEGVKAGTGLRAPFCRLLQKP